MVKYYLLRALKAILIFLGAFGLVLLLATTIIVHPKFVAGFMIGSVLTMTAVIVWDAAGLID